MAAHATADADRMTARCEQAQSSIQRIWTSTSSPRVHRKTSSPPILSIPLTSPERLALASPDNPSDSARTYLYLAYGSNLSSDTFLVQRGIRPLSKVNVSAPAFDLTFDLPGLPYREPCFANTALRKIPRPPIPGVPAKPPFDPPFKPPRQQQNDTTTTASPALPGRGPRWTKGLIGIVYEVTPTDYATIIKTEGGGSGYQDVLTPVVALPPAFQIPEKPLLPPELPRPFLAHTLYAPRLPADPPPPDKWWQEFLTPVRRPEPDYAQPSPRYLGLIREGARENYLPDDYQEYLAKLEGYMITQRRQEIGKWVVMMLWAPAFLLLIGLSWVLADKDGRVPRWLAVTMSVFLNAIWMSYDAFFKKWFGDGERTTDEDEDDIRGCTGVDRGRGWRRMLDGNADEKSRLLADW